MDKTLYPASVMGEIDIPASKGQTFRALMLALCARGVSVIHNPRLTPDTQVCIDFIKKLGAKVTFSDNTMIVDSTDLNPKDDITIDCKNSGSSLFYASAISSIFGIKVSFIGDESLKHRPIRPLLKSLSDLGATIEPRDCESIPFTIQGPIKGGHTSIRCMTNQYLSALLMACPMAKKDTTIDVPLLYEKTYADMTERWLKSQDIDFFRDKDMSHYTIKGSQHYKAFERDINGDFSSATSFFCAAAITGNTITVNGLDSHSSQGDREILPILQSMGCIIQDTNHTITVTGPNKLIAKDLDLGNCPDALPALAVISCFASGPVRLYNVTQARLKESDRIKAIVESINAIGGRAKEMPDGIEIFPVVSFKEGTVDSYNDHRIVMAMAIASLKCTGALTIKNVECIDLRFPSFFEKFNSILI